MILTWYLALDMYMYVQIAMYILLKKSTSCIFFRLLKEEQPRFPHHSTQNKMAGKGKVFRVLQNAHAAT